MDEKLAYEEAGRVHRYFLNWRHAAFAGYFVVLYAVASLALKVWDKPSELVAVLLLSAPIGLALALVDYRTRQLYYAAVQAAKAIEAGEKGNLYARISEPPRGWPSNFPGPHSLGLWFVYVFYSLVLLIAGLLLLGPRWFTSMNDMTIILNSIGLLSGLAGTALVWKYGLPSIELLSEGSYSEIQITPKMKTYTRRSRLGLALIGAGFLLQLIAVWA